MFSWEYWNDEGSSLKKGWISCGETVSCLKLFLYSSDQGPLLWPHDPMTLLGHAVADEPAAKTSGQCLPGAITGYFYVSTVCVEYTKSQRVALLTEDISSSFLLRVHSFSLILSQYEKQDFKLKTPIPSFWLLTELTLKPSILNSFHKSSNIFFPFPALFETGIVF